MARSHQPELTPRLTRHSYLLISFNPGRAAVTPLSALHADIRACPKKHVPSRLSGISHRGAATQGLLLRPRANQTARASSFGRTAPRDGTAATEHISAQAKTSADLQALPAPPPNW